ncbi:MAG: DUF1573 domain-containing protein [Phycisphaerae bacterium]
MLTRRRTRTVALGALLAAVNSSNGQNTEPAPADNSANQATAGPRLVLSQKEWNFGQVWYGDPCETEVELRNAGDATLKIINVKSSCGCTVAKPRKNELAPGEADTMLVTYDTRKNRKKVTHTITIETNDPVEPRIRFRVYGEVWHVFDAKPYAVVGFGLIRPESEKAESIELHNNLQAKVFPKIRPLDPRAPFEVNLEEIEAGAKYKLVARTKPPLRLGISRTTVVLETGVERLPTMSIPVTAIVLDRVSVRPDRLRIVPTQTRVGSRTLRVNYTEDQPIEITEIKTSHPSVKVHRLSARRSRAGKTEFASHQLRVTLPPFAGFPDEGVRIEIHTNDRDPKFQKFVVPIEKKHSLQPKVKKVSRKPGGAGGKPD